MNITFLKIQIVLIVLLFQGCQYVNKEYTLASGSIGATYHTVGNEVAKLWSPIIKVDVESGSHLGSYSNCVSIIDNQFDFCLAQNDSPIEIFVENPSKSLSDYNVRTLFPLYPEILFIVHADSIQPESLTDLVIGRKVALGPKHSGGARFMIQLLLEYGVDTTEYTPVFTEYEKNVISEETPISCSITGFNNYRIHKMLNNSGVLFSLGNPDRAFKGSVADGLSYRYIAAKPYIIPKSTYGKYPEEPALTFAIDAVLLVREEVDEYLVYDLVRSIIENKQILASQNPIFSSITEKFDINKLTFPLHAGTRMYLERNEPTFIEQYAEVLGLILSVLVISSGSISSYFKRSRDKKQKRLKGLYNKLWNYNLLLDNISSQEEIDGLSRNLKEFKMNLYELHQEDKIPDGINFNNILLLLTETENKILNTINSR